MLQPEQPGAAPAERAQVVELLDEFQAAERAGAAAISRWAAVCANPRLRAGLRVIEVRDRGHAAVAEARLRALGGEPSADVNRPLATLCALIADPRVPDRSKLSMLLSRFPAEVEDTLRDFARRIESDAETRALLEAIGDDERASIRWLHEMRESLERDAAS